MQRIFPYGLLILLSISILSCSLDEPEQSSGTFPLQFLVEQEFSLITLSWTPVKVTGFKEYILLHSSAPIPASPTPEVNANVTILKRIDDADVASYLASEVLFSPQACFKLYASVDDRFIESASICVEQDFTLLEGFYDKAAHDQGLTDMILYDRVNRKLTVFNYESGSVINSVQDDILGFPILDLDSWAGTTNLLGYDQSPPRLQKYSFPELSPQQVVFFGGVLFAAKGHEQFVFVTTEESGKGFKSLSKNSLVELDNESGLTGSRNLAVFDGDPVIVLEVGINGIRRYSVGSGGKITFLDQKSNGLFQTQLQNTTAQGKDIFIAGRSGEIINRNGNIIATLISNVNASVLMSRLTADDTRAAYLMSDNGEVRLVIVDLTGLPHIQTIFSFDLPPANYADLIVDGDVVYVFGVSFTSGSSQTFSLKYPMS